MRLPSASASAESVIGKKLHAWRRHCFISLGNMSGHICVFAQGFGKWTTKSPVMAFTLHFSLSSLPLSFPAA